MDPVLVLLLGGVLLLGASISLGKAFKAQQCPGCLSLSFGTEAQEFVNPSTGLTCKMCNRCGCTVEASERR